MAIKTPLWDFPGHPVAKAASSRCRGPGFDPGSGKYILHATMKDSTCRNGDLGQSNKYIFKKRNKQRMKFLKEKKERKEKEEICGPIQAGPCDLGNGTQAERAEGVGLAMRVR